MRKLLLLALLPVAWACDSANPSKDAQPQDTTVPGDVTEEVDSGPVCVAARTIGQPCSQDCECLGGICLLNEWAPFRFCSSECASTKPGALCPPDPGAEQSTSLCVQLPTELEIPPARFCVPLCNNGVLDCKATGSAWEQCGAPAYKKVELFDTSDSVCMAPSANGHAPIDPDTCEGWDALYDAWPEVRPACNAYCQFLKECLYIPAGNSLACCPYACARYVAPVAAPDSALMDTVTCFTQVWSAFQGTGLLCTEAEESCGDVIELDY